MSNAPSPLVEAQLLLAQVHLDHGRPAEAFATFEIAARSGEAAALNMLGRAYERGWGIARDAGMAARCFSRAVEGGDAWAAFNLADLHMQGEGVERDLPRAYALYVTAARAGNGKALNMLGLLHEDGAIAAPDPAGAMEFFQAAAATGDCWGCFNHARLLLQAGDIEAALPVLRRGLENGFGDFYAAMAEAFETQQEPRLRALGAEAARRLAEPHAA